MVNGSCGLVHMVVKWEYYSPLRRVQVTQHFSYLTSYDSKRSMVTVILARQGWIQGGVQGARVPPTPSPSSSIINRNRSKCSNRAITYPNKTFTYQYRICNYVYVKLQVAAQFLSVIAHWNSLNTILRLIRFKIFLGAMPPRPQHISVFYLTVSLSWTLT